MESHDTHFTEEKTDCQKGYMICQKLNSWEVEEAEVWSQMALTLKFSHEPPSLLKQNEKEPGKF